MSKKSNDHLQELTLVQNSIRSNGHRARLGRGLAALLGENPSGAPAANESRGVRKAPIEFLRPNPRNPRKNFSEEELDELAISIRERGVLQPILVRAVPRVADAYEIIAGERRWRAGQRAGLHDVPIIELEVGDRQALEIAIIENVQRSDLNALEEGSAYVQLGVDFGYSHEDIAKVVGKSRSHVTNTLRLLKLPEFTRTLLSEGKISAGHARALLSVENADQVAREIVAKGLTVRDTEGLNDGRASETKSKKGQIARRDINTVELERNIALAIGAKVTVRAHGDGGVIRIEYQTLEQLESIFRRLAEAR
jgi:ParB family chromosome partitioning protein